MDDATRKYRNEPEFHQLVEAIRAMIVKAQFTPTEVKQAAVFACILYEQQNAAPFFNIEQIEERMRLVLGRPHGG